MIESIEQMNTQTIGLNRKNVAPSTNKTKPLVSDRHEIALASVNMYYSWANIQQMYENNVISSMWCE